MIKKLILSLLFLGCLFVLFLVSVMSMDAPSSTASNFYITFCIGFVVLILIFYALNWLISDQNKNGLGKKILLSLGLLFLLFIFLQPTLLVILHFSDLDIEEILQNLSIPVILIVLIVKKFRKKELPKAPLSAEEIEKRKKDYEAMLNNHLITQENYEKLIKQLETHS